MSPVKRGSKYAPLGEALRRRPDAVVVLSLEEIESVLGEPLPPTARTGAGFWSNRTSGLQSAAWLEAGFRVADIDLHRGTVSFARRNRIPPARIEAGEVRWNGDLVRALRDHLGLNQRDMARQLGVRQQTISEWESGVYEPTRARSRHLSLIAERSGFPYSSEVHPRGGVDTPSGTV
jgi:DNA-binding XRE family transcriptional regulator